MAAIESIGFSTGVQPAHLRFVSIARSIPLRVAHPPPQFLSLNPVCPRTSGLDRVEKVCLDAPN